MLTFLTIVPFIALSLMAQGTMVAAGPTPNSFMVVLCGDHQPVEMVLDDDGTVVPADEYRSGHHLPVPKTSKAPCDWSLHAQPMLEAAPLLAHAVLNMARPADLPAMPALRVLRAQILAPLARGPPLI